MKNRQIVVMAMCFWAIYMKIWFSKFLWNKKIKCLTPKFSLTLPSSRSVAGFLGGLRFGLGLWFWLWWFNLMRNLKFWKLFRENKFKLYDVDAKCSISEQMLFKTLWSYSSKFYSTCFFGDFGITCSISKMSGQGYRKSAASPPYPFSSASPVTCLLE